jgi:hypothetical protein
MVLSDGNRVKSRAVRVGLVRAVSDTAPCPAPPLCDVRVLLFYLLLVNLSLLLPSRRRRSDLPPQARFGRSGHLFFFLVSVDKATGRQKTDFSN